MRSDTSTEDSSIEAAPIDRALAWCTIAASLVVRILYVYRYRFDSDEPQLLHVVWGWVNGLLPYRDVFDNHAPLFSLLSAPVLWAAGERPGALFVMRLAMIPLYLVSLAAVHRIGSILHSRRVGLWAAALTAPCWGFFACSVQFRGDDLWAALWLAALAILLQPSPTSRRAWLSGLVLGAAMSTSMKTTVMLVSLVAALAAVGVLSRDREGALSPGRIARHVAAGIAGLVTIPLALALFFYARDAWPQLLYGVVSHNVLQGFDWWEGGAARLALFPVALPLLWWGGGRVVRGSADPSRGARRGVVFLANGIYATVLLGAWPVLTRQDFLPFFPLLVVTVTPAILSIARRAGRPDRSPGGVTREVPISLAPGLAAAIQIAVLLALAPLSADGTKEEIALLKDVLRLTDRGQPVIDLKGETIFRPRPSFYVFEKLTNERFSRGDIEDRIPEALVASGTCVAVRHGQLFPPRARAFLDANFLRVGHLRVAGRWLTSGGSGATKPVAFDVAIPARYAIVAQGGAVTGLLDGVPYAGPRDLREGPHVYESHGVVGETALIWAQAVERGYGPRFGGRRAGEANGRAAGASPRRSEAASW